MSSMDNNSDLNSSLASREKILGQLSRIFLMAQLPPSIFINGPAQSGKTYLIKKTLNCPDMGHLRWAMVSSQPGTYDSRLILESILAQLHGLPRTTGKNHCAPFKCDSLLDFVNHFISHKEFLQPDEFSGLVIILKQAEKFAELDSNILNSLMNLQELTGLNICVVFLSIISFSKLMVPGGLPKPIRIEIDSFKEDELALIIAKTLKDNENSSKVRNNSNEEKDVELDDHFFYSYARTIVTLSYNICNSLPRLIHLADLHFPMYKKPVIEGKIDPQNFRAHLRQIEKPLRDSLTSLHLRESSSTQFLKETNKVENKNIQGRLYVELPFHSKYLLIASYLASYNPDKSDKRFFMQHHGKQRKTKAMIKSKENRISSQLTGPRAFPMDRMIAIFYSILNDDISSSSNIFSQITTLVSLEFLMQVGSGDPLEQPRYKCLVSLDFIEQLSKQVGFEIHRYLYDFN